jgi:HAD superfamily hydrolase (TIGR01509 family)
MKTTPSLFTTILNEIGRNPTECLFIDDRQVNLLTALKVGIQSLAFISASSLIGRLDKIGVW